eukprot:ANDGO_00831.mRNA.1 Acyl-homoserine lactone acylase QuiP
MAVCALSALAFVLFCLISGFHIMIRCGGTILFMSLLSMLVFLVLVPACVVRIARSVRQARSQRKVTSHHRFVDMHDEDGVVREYENGQHNENYDAFEFAEFVPSPIPRQLRSPVGLAVEYDADDPYCENPQPTAAGGGRTTTCGASTSMRLCARICGWFVVFVIWALVLSVFVIYVYTLSVTVAIREGDLDAPGLQATVKVKRDGRGFIKIEAQNEHDAFFAQGYVVAQERLWQLEFQRIIVTGRLSEIAGDAGIEIDKFLRTMGFFHYALLAYEHLEPDVKRAFDAYTAGVNAFVKSGKTAPEFLLLGLQPRHFSPQELLGWSKMMAYELSENFQAEALRLDLLMRGLRVSEIFEAFPTYPSSGPSILDHRDVGINDTQAAANSARIQGSIALEMARIKNAWEGQRKSTRRHPASRNPSSLQLGRDLGITAASNNWVYAAPGNKSILANDPHLDLMSPALWIGMTISFPRGNGETPYWAQGSCLAGTPGVVIGRNKYISWGVTNAGVDVQDLYEINVTADGTAYFWRNSTIPFIFRTETIHVQGSGSVDVIIRTSHYGPVLTDTRRILDLHDSSKVLALKWTSQTERDSTATSFFRINLARNFTEFREALRTYVAPSQNFVYADVDGNIGYMCPGLIPIRVSGHSGMFPISGNGEFDWVGYIPFEELPFVFNPPKRFIVTANNKIIDGYPYILTFDYAAPYRWQRIHDLLDGQSPELADAAFMSSVQYDRISYFWKDMKDFVLSLDPGLRFRDVQLHSWDGNTNAGSKEASVLALLFVELSKWPGETYNLGVDQWNSQFFVANKFGKLNATANPDAFAFARKALDRAVELSLGRLPEYGKEFHSMHALHPLLGKTVIGCLVNMKCVSGGDFGTPNAAPVSQSNYEHRHAASVRHVITLSRSFQEFRISLPGSQTGNWIEPTFAELLSLWEEGKTSLLCDESSKSAELTLHP